MDEFFYYDNNHAEFVFKGCLGFEQTNMLLQKWESIRHHDSRPLCVNCALIVKADSSFLALLIEMRRWAKEKNQRWELKKLPLFLNNFLSVYGIEDFLKNDPSFTS
jgi:ABC-type transporter Mla MlaB component